jgi:hypothetical protein
MKTLNHKKRHLNDFIASRYIGTAFFCFVHHSTHVPLHYQLSFFVQISYASNLVLHHRLPSLHVGSKRKRRCLDRRQAMSPQLTVPFTAPVNNLHLIDILGHHGETDAYNDSPFTK